ncbi:MAG: hypothetical protein P8012_05720 [Desulfobacterales bacterium]
MNHAPVIEEKSARFSHFDQKPFIPNILITGCQTEPAVLRKQMRNRGIQCAADPDQIKEGDFNDDVRHPASGSITIIRTSEIQFGVEKIGLAPENVILHDLELLF